MKRIFPLVLTLVCGMALLVACVRPAQTPPDTAPEDTTAPLTDDKPDEGLEVPLDSSLDATNDGAADPAADPNAEGEAPADDGTVEGSPGVTEETVDPATDNEAEAPAEAVEVIHEVQSGDTLYGISLIYGISAEAIIQANQLANPDSLDVGQKLIIPGEEPVVVDDPPAEPTDDGAEEPAGSDTAVAEHIVQPGETLYRIGLIYGYTVDELAAFNQLTNVNQLEVGQTILIPPKE